MIKDDVIIDDQNKSDTYSISINSIILLHKPNNLPSLCKLLDDNGYYGRYTIMKKVTKNHGETVINIEVYLPNSCFSYLWPFRTMYNLTLGRLLKKIKLRKIPAMPYVLSHLSSDDPTNPLLDSPSIEELPYRIMKVNGSRNHSYYQYIVATMLHAGLFKISHNKKLVFKLKDNDDDLKELMENLFNPDNYLD
jgi:hypothetical protein